MSKQNDQYILIVEDEAELLELEILCLETVYRGSIKGAKSVDDAIKILTENPAAVLIITDHNMPQKTGVDLENYILQKNWTIPLVVCSGRPREEISPLYKNLNGYVEKPHIVEPLSALVVNILEKTNAAGPKSNYLGVRPSTLLRLGFLNYELYIRLSKEKFVRLAHGSSYFEPEDAKKLLTKKVKHLYLKISDAKNFLHEFQSNLSMLEMNKNLSSQEMIHLTLEVTDTVHNLFQTFGWSEDIQVLVQKSTVLALKVMEQEPKILALLKEHQREDGSFVSAHSNLLTFLCCGLAQSLDWISDLTSTKLCMAATLHDLTLSAEEEESIKILNDEAAGKNPSPPVKKYMEHPHNASALLANMKNLPPDIDKIISQHHEKPDGTGFPAKLNHSRINPLAALFIVAEDLVNEIEANPKEELNVLVQNFITSRSEYYSNSYFKKVLNSLAIALQI